VAVGVKVLVKESGFEIVVIFKAQGLERRLMNEVRKSLKAGAQSKIPISIL
jgi:ribosomal protein L10